MKDFPCIITWSVTVALVCCFSTVLAQNPQCELSKNQLGVCVHVNKCNNVFKILEKQKQNIPIPARVADYLKQIKCDLPGVPEGQSVCCRLEQVRLLPADCGRNTGDRVSGGEKALLFEFPWMALLRYYKSNEKELVNGCGGTLISSRYVLTAAHCIKVDRSWQLAHIRLGEYNLNQDKDCSESEDEEEVKCAESVQDHEIESSVIHPQYERFKNDIALVRLKREVQFADHIKPICLPTTSYLKTITFSNYQVAGWGVTEDSTGSDVLLKANVPVRSIEQCEIYFNQFRVRKLRLNDNILICAGGEGIVDTCKGDSGGPLMGAAEVDHVTRYIQFGVTSFGIDECGRANSTTAFTKVATMMEWIMDNIQS